MLAILPACCGTGKWYLIAHACISATLMYKDAKSYLAISRVDLHLLGHSSLVILDLVDGHVLADVLSRDDLFV